MKLYIAAPWTHKAAAARVAANLESLGHTITKRWWEHREVPGYLTNDHSNDAELRAQAIEDFAGICDADAFILLNLEKSEGKAVETGMAIMLDLPIVVIGGRSNLFHYLADIVFVPEGGDINQAIIEATAAA